MAAPLHGRPAGTPTGDQSAKGREDSIPKSRVDEMVTRAVENARLQERAAGERERREDAERIAGRGGSPPADPSKAEDANPDEPRILTPDEIEDAVEKGKITRTEATQYQITQGEKRGEARATEAASSARATADLSAEVNGKIDQYLERHPALKAREGEDWTRLEAKVQELSKRGHANDARTELLALEMVFGELGDDIREITREHRDVHEETGGGGHRGRPARAAEGDPDGDWDKSAAPPWFDSKLTFHYSAMIKDGHYTGWNDPLLVKEAEIKRDQMRPGE